MNIKFFKRKALALQKAQSLNQILANKQVTDYFITESYSSFLETIISSDSKNFYECILANKPVCFFFDIEIYKDKSDFFEKFEEIIDLCKNKVKELFNDTHQIKAIVLESHKEDKKSFHIIFRVFDLETNKEMLFKDVQVLKDLYKQFGFAKLKDKDNKHIIDPSVYREGLFRTIYSSKNGENRPLVKSQLSDEFEDIETFIGYNTDNYTLYEQGEVQVEEIIELTPENIIVNVPEDLDDNDKEFIKRFVTSEYHHFPNTIRDIFVDKQHNCIIVALMEKYCPVILAVHKNNNQYIVIDTTSSKQKCHDSDCNEHKTNEIKMESYPKQLNEIIKKCLRINKQEMELINKAIDDCKTYITENFDKDVQEVSFDRKEMIFRGDVGNRNLVNLLEGTCPECNVEHQIGDNGYCLKCKVCNSIFPKKQLIPIDQKFKNLNNFWTNYQIGTINNNFTINNIYHSTEEDFSCDVTLDNNIFRNKELTRLFNQILYGHKVVKISELMSKIETDFKYTNGEWYYFNGSIWKQDKECLEFRKRIVKLSQQFNRIQQHYESKSTHENISLIKNIKNLINKLHKTGFEDDVIKGAKMYYHDETFFKYLNSKKHLVPFTNGVYDLLENKFRKTKREDFINFTLGYEYSENIYNTEVIDFVNSILPNGNIRNYVLKKMSECLNGDIPNTNFLMFIGDGANGKSQLLNLMKLCMGEFGEKVEVTLLTRKRNNANEANTEKMKLMNKRFAFLSEPEDGEKINIGLLKELTGSEEIVARGLYQESHSFVMEAKLFLACNELPDIKGEDTALWRRIRVIDFPSRFVDQPKEDNEFPIDRTLPSRMREDLSWRQTFVKLLLEYYNMKIIEPDEIKVRTKEYQSQHDINSLFVEQCLVREGEGVKWTDVWSRYQTWYYDEFGKTPTDNKQELKHYLETKIFKTKANPIRRIGRGWLGWALKSSDDDDDVFI